jgi:hypothetical protein
MRRSQLPERIAPAALLDRVFGEWPEVFGTRDRDAEIRADLEAPVPHEEFKAPFRPYDVL